MKILYSAEIEDCSECLLIAFAGFSVNPESLDKGVQVWWQCKKDHKSTFNIFPCKVRPCPLEVREEK